MNYVYRYEIAAVIISFSVMVSLFRKKVISTRAINTFSAINTLVFVSSFADIIAILLLKTPGTYPVWLVYSVNMVYHLTYHTIGLLFYYCDRILLLISINHLHGEDHDGLYFSSQRIIRIGNEDGQPR